MICASAIDELQLSQDPPIRRSGAPIAVEVSQVDQFAVTGCAPRRGLRLRCRHICWDRGMPSRLGVSA